MYKASMKLNMNIKEIKNVVELKKRTWRQFLINVEMLRGEVRSFSLEFKFQWWEGFYNSKAKEIKGGIIYIYIYIYIYSF